MENKTTTVPLTLREYIANPRQVYGLLKENLEKLEIEWNWNYDNSKIGLKNIQLGNTQTGYYFDSDVTYNDIKNSHFADYKFNCDDLWQSAIQDCDNVDDNEYDNYCDFVNRRKNKSDDEEDYIAYRNCVDRYDEYIKNYSDVILLTEFSNLKDEKIEYINKINQTKQSIQDIIEEFSEIDFTAKETV
jgi:hypothetical protein